jgi:hypothetical protein
LIEVNRKSSIFRLKLALALSSHTSTSIEGNPLPLTEVKQILKKNPTHIRDTELEILNYNEALEYLKTIAPAKPIIVLRRSLASATR